MDLLGFSSPVETDPIPGSAYIQKLHKYLKANLPRLAPPTKTTTSSSFLQQSYTLLTLGLDPNSAPLSRSVKVPLTLGFGTPSPPRQAAVKPLLLRLPPDRLLYLLLRWQSLPQNLPYVGRTDVPIAPGVPVGARGAKVDGRETRGDGDVQSVRSWVGSMRSVSLGSRSGDAIPGMGWFRKREEIDEDHLLLSLYSVFSILPSLLIHPPFTSDRPILDLVEAGGYTQLGGIDVRVPLDVLRNLQVLELEGYDPRGLLLPQNPGMRSLTVRDVQDADDWLEELLRIDEEGVNGQARFPNLRHLCLKSTTLLTFPTLPLSNLTSLDLSFNLLNSIPSSLSTLHSLQSINLSNNVITSLRNAPSVLGNITSLNLSKNRIDCLVGLERVLGLERVDVRGNLLEESSEVGRLAVLPQIKEIWCTGNPFDLPQPASIAPIREVEDWRIELGATFTAEGKGEIVLDDKPFSWSESRKIENVMTSRGQRVVPPNRGVMGSASRPESWGETSRSAQSGHSHSQSHILSSQGTQLSPSPKSRIPSTDSPKSSTSPIQPKRKPRRRVVELDTEEGADQSEDSLGSQDVGGGVIGSGGGSMRAQGSVGDSLKIPPKSGRGKERRARVSVSMFEPSSEAGEQPT